MTLPVTVITGFLGSGKTTLINGLLRDPAMAETAVLVNELGEIGLDHLLVEHVDDTTMLLGAGCLCCSLREELVAGIKTLLARRTAGSVPNFGHLLIETTGLADPAPVLHTLLADDDLRRSCHVAGIVVTVDALHGAEQLRDHAACLNQAAAADRIVLTKTDLASAQDLVTLREKLTELNPGAKIVTAPMDAATLLAFDQDGSERWLNTVPDRTKHDPTITSVSLETAVPLDAHHLVGWIDRVTARYGNRLLRFKGITNLRGSPVPVAVHGVGHVFHPLSRMSAWRGDERSSRLVLIGHKLCESELRESFQSMTKRCHH